MEDLAAEQRWLVEEAADGRWRLYASVEPALLREAVELLDRFHLRLDEILGGPAPPGGPQAPEPVLLCFFRTQEDVDRVCGALAEGWPHLREWSETARAFPRLQHWRPLLAVVLHDARTAKILRPDVQVAHMAVLLELARRYGRVPFWVGEALGYALQDEITGGVYGFCLREWGENDVSWHLRWGQSAREVLARRAPSASVLAEGSGVNFDQERAYLQLAVARQWIAAAPDGLRRFLESLAAARPAKLPLDMAFEPAAAEQEALLAQAFGDGWVRGVAHEAAARWPAEAAAATVASARPPSRGPEILAALEREAAARKLRALRQAGGRVVLWTDFREGDARAALDACTSVLRRLDQVLGPSGAAAEPAGVLLLQRRESYAALCDAVASADPVLRGFMAQSRSTTGFTIYEPLLTAYFHDTGVQEEASPAHSAAHNVVHLELARRFGPLPLWLAEGVACAVEDAALGAVYGNWYREGFVFTASHTAWRGEAARLVQGDAYSLRNLFAYDARQYDGNLAHLAFAFATWGMEAEPLRFGALLRALQEEYERTATRRGRFELAAERAGELAGQALGADFEARFEAWWKKPPARPELRSVRGSGR